MENGATLATIWEVPGHLWAQLHTVILELDPPKATGRKRADPGQMLNGIIFRLRSGCQWNHLPKELGDDSTIHRTFQPWVGVGVFQRIWTLLTAECAELGDVYWEWQSADCAMGKARFGGMGLDPTPRTEARRAASAVSWSKPRVAR